jgi:hypothetical protein
MPFQSEKQRRYMHANLPDIANRWERDYAGGGRTGFDNGSNGITLGSDKYNIKLEPGASGSWTSQDLGHGSNVDQKNIAYGVDTTANIGPVEIGMDYKKFLDKYNVTEDGATVEKDTNRDRDIAYMLGLNLEDLYAKIDSDRDFKNFYFTIRKTFGGPKDMNQGGMVPAHEAGIYGLAEGGVPDIGFSKVKPSNDGSRPGYFTAEYGGGDTSSSGSVGGEQADRPADMPAHLSYTAPTTKTTTTVTDDKGGGDQEEDVARMMKDMGIKDKYNAPDYGKGWVEAETDYGAGDYSTNKDKAYDLDFRYGHKIKPKDQWTKHNKQNAWIEKKQLAKDAFDAFKFGIGPMSLLKFGWKQSKKKKAEKEHLQKMIDRMKEAGMTKFSPHSDTPLQLAEQLMLDMTTTKKDKDDTDDKGQGVLEVSSITYDDMEDTNKKQRASAEWRQEQEKVDRSKQMAYWRMMMEPYMSAQGGRVPGGYNTGGLSNLFRLKNV